MKTIIGRLHFRRISKNRADLRLIRLIAGVAWIGLVGLFFSPPLKATNAPSLFFQEGTSLGILTLNTTSLPTAWQGIGAMSSGWQERAIADLNGDGIPDIIFQNGTLIGALIMNANGTPNSWIGIGSMNAGWQLYGAATITGDGNLDLIFQNGTLLGYLEVNHSGQPVSWNGIGAMGTGWQLRAVATLEASGRPDLIFQNSTLLGALQVSTVGVSTAWTGIGSLAVGWVVSGAVDVTGSGHPNLVLQNGDMLGALQINTSFQPIAWSGIGAMGSGWVLAGLPPLVFQGRSADSNITLGYYQIDAAADHGIWQEVQKDSSGNYVATTGLTLVSMPDNTYERISFDPTTGLPTTLRLSNGGELVFTVFNSTQETATVNVIYNGSLVQQGVTLPLNGLLSPQVMASVKRPAGVFLSSIAKAATFTDQSDLAQKEQDFQTIIKNADYTNVNSIFAPAASGTAFTSIQASISSTYDTVVNAFNNSSAFGVPIKAWYEYGKAAVSSGSYVSDSAQCLDAIGAAVITEGADFVPLLYCAKAAKDLYSARQDIAAGIDLTPDVDADLNQITSDTSSSPTTFSYTVAWPGTGDQEVSTTVTQVVPGSAAGANQVDLADALLKAQELVQYSQALSDQASGIKTEADAEALSYEQAYATAQQSANAEANLYASDNIGTGNPANPAPTPADPDPATAQAQAGASGVASQDYQNIEQAVTEDMVNPPPNDDTSPDADADPVAPDSSDYGG